MQKNNSYLPALDGIRAISILLVLTAHLDFENLIPGGFGVTIFFYVSGFLITKLLIEEFNKRNTISLKKFYIRRLLRLYPPILFMVLITLAVPALLQTVRLPELLAALFYYENYFFLRHYEALKNVTSFVFFWSLSVEEHFYLLFPLILTLLIGVPKKLLIVIIALMAAALAARFYVVWHYQVNEFSGMYCDLATTCRIDSILIGCFSAVLISTRYGERYIGFISKVPVFVSALAVLFFCVLFRNELFRQTIRYTMQNVALMAVIPAILYSAKYAWLNRLLCARPLVFTGKLSYSLYLLHGAAYVTIDSYVTPYGRTVPYFFLSLTLVFLLALVSYNLIEKPVMKLRRRFGSGAMEPVWQNNPQINT